MPIFLHNTPDYDYLVSLYYYYYYFYYYYYYYYYAAPVGDGWWWQHRSLAAGFRCPRGACEGRTGSAPPLPPPPRGWAPRSPPPAATAAPAWIYTRRRCYCMHLLRYAPAALAGPKPYTLNPTPCDVITPWVSLCTHSDCGVSTHSSRGVSSPRGRRML